MNNLNRNGSGYTDFTAFKAIMNTEGNLRMDVLRGDIFYIKKSNDAIGSEYDGGRPAVIVSNDIGNEKSGVVEIVYLTTSNKRMDMPTHISITGRLPSIALCEQVHTVSKDRLGDYMKSCTAKEMAAIDDALKISLGLKNDNSNLEAKDAEVEKLKVQLKEAGAKIKEQKLEIKELQQAFDDKCDVCTLNQELDELKNSKVIKEKADINELETYIIQLETERDLYKEQYESLLERILNK